MTDELSLMAKGESYYKEELHTALMQSEHFLLKTINMDLFNKKIKNLWNEAKRDGISRSTFYNWLEHSFPDIIDEVKFKSRWWLF